MRLLRQGGTRVGLNADGDSRDSWSDQGATSIYALLKPIRENEAMDEIQSCRPPLPLQTKFPNFSWPSQYDILRMQSGILLDSCTDDET